MTVDETEHTNSEPSESSDELALIYCFCRPFHLVYFHLRLPLVGIRLEVMASERNVRNGWKTDVSFMVRHVAFLLRNDLEPEPMRGVGRTDFVKNQRKCLNL